MNKKITQPQPTEKNPIVVENYPYGFKRTQIRYWVESVKKKGDRFCSQTLNPKTNLWNKPKKATYNAVNVVYEDEKGHITYYGLWRSTDKEDYQKFIDFIGDLELNELQKEELRIFRAYVKTYENVSYEIRKVQYRNKETGEIVEEIPLMQISKYEKVSDEEYQEDQAKIQESINQNVAYNYYNDEGVLK